MLKEGLWVTYERKASFVFNVANLVLFIDSILSKLITLRAQRILMMNSLFFCTQKLTNCFNSSWTCFIGKWCTTNFRTNFIQWGYEFMMRILRTYAIYDKYAQNDECLQANYLFAKKENLWLFRIFVWSWVRSWQADKMLIEIC